eukprot:c5296_g1_i1.p1 GENE.c5296_g1_i1~~c5296_g1_i1.p1  ORF type:complete len:404 (+),score=89.77 c5296_g1_i1:41-1213(+)
MGNTASSATPPQQPNVIPPMEHIFANLFPNPQAPPPGWHPSGPFAPPPRQQSPPPASERAIRQLPTIKITEEDLIDESNGTCSICLDSHSISEIACRLPCGHLFHRDCVTEWLKQNCTCPVCRYELETDDPEFEKQRKLRMGRRRLRITERELRSKTVKQLRRLMIDLNISTVGCLEKSDMVSAIVHSGRVDIIRAPPPAEFTLHQLRLMNTHQLLDVMKRLGVTVDRSVVLEKEDVVQALVNSGRIIVIEAEVYSYTELLSMPISELKSMARERHISIDHCLEKREIVSQLLESGVVVLHEDSVLNEIRSQSPPRQRQRQLENEEIVENIENVQDVEIATDVFGGILSASPPELMSVESDSNIANIANIGNSPVLADASVSNTPILLNA